MAESATPPNLSLNFGWSGILLEGEPAAASSAAAYYAAMPRTRETVQVQTCWVTRENFNELLTSANVRNDVDLLSIDIDGNDYWLWDALEAVRPRVVVIEYNAFWGSTDSVVVPYTASFRRFEAHSSGLYFGASLAALSRLASAKGYVLLGCDSSGANAFYGRADVVGESVASVSPEEAFYPGAFPLEHPPASSDVEAVKQLPVVPIASR